MSLNSSIIHNNTANPSGSCACNRAATGDEPTPRNHSVSWSRLTTAMEQAHGLLSKKQAKAKCLLEDAKVHCFDKGFGAGTWAISQDQLTFAAAGVVDKIPSLFSVVFDTRFFDNAGKGDDHNILWVELDIVQPIPQKFRVPFRGVGVLRDPGSGNLIRCEDFELATELIADVKDVAKVIACVLACVGLFCAAFCAPLCIAIIACVGCLATCVGANLPQFLICVTACGVAVDGIGDAIT